MIEPSGETRKDTDKGDHFMKTRNKEFTKDMARDFLEKLFEEKDPDDLTEKELQNRLTMHYGSLDKKPDHH